MRLCFNIMCFLEKGASACTCKIPGLASGNKPGYRKIMQLKKQARKEPIHSH